MPLNSLTHVNLLIFLSSCFPCQIHSCCSWMNTLMNWPFEQLPLANNAPSSWRNTLECQQHQTNRHLYLFHHIPTNDFILDVHLRTSWSSHGIAWSPLPQQLCSYWKTVSPQWCCTFWSICYWSSFSSLSLRVSFLYAKPFSVRVLDLVALPLLPCRMMPSLALCSTHCEYELSSGTLNVSPILVQVS